MSENYLKIWGTRGSTPTADNDKMKFGGETSCVEIRTSENDAIILDMGSGIRGLGKHILENPEYPKTIHIFLSHYHWDHIMGFLSFAPLFDEKYTINIYGQNNNTPISTLPDVLLQSDFWPVNMDMISADLNFKSFDSDSITINNTKIMYTLHGHPNGANSFRIENNTFSIVYTTDCEHPEGSLNHNVVKLSKDADILIHDSHFTIEDLVNHKGWGHSSWKQAVDVAIESKTKKLILFHHSPDYSDDKVSEIEQNAQKKFPNTISAYQGLTIHI